ncbi:MAG: sulfoxide reductase heme-binding subunit YedZ [Rhizobiales bacterium PAR1]|nr:MAG: sulfoxide reductase heme-binding subunit YedZ [Rhizobiales bacterium PAR1]
MLLEDFKLWNDRKGQFSPLKAATLALVCLPALWIAFRLASGMLGAKPIEAALHETGLWATRLLLITLAVTPCRLITGQNKIVLIRRMLGVAALVYTLIHFSLYIVDQRFDLIKVASEIVLRFYLTIGAISLIAMTALGVTSTDGMIRRMSALAWNRLHFLIYPLTLLGLWHGALQSKINVSEAAVMTGLFLALIGVRVMRRRFEMGVLPLIGLVLLSVIVTAGLEAAWYGLATGIPPERIFAANLMIDLQPRPALVVGMIASVLPLLALLSRWLPGTRPPRTRSK